MSGTELVFRKVSKSFRTEARGEVWALRDVELACPPGVVTCVVGPSGCGKTTLLRLAAGLDQPTGGTVQSNGGGVAGAHHVALVSQEGDLFPWRRVADNVGLGLEIQHVPKAVRRAKVDEILKLVGLPANSAESFLHELSGGMRRRVALARALCLDPKILLLDEPFSALDEPTRHRLQSELFSLISAAGRTVLFVTHDLEEAVFLGDRIVLLAEGRKREEFDIGLARPRDRLSDDFGHVLLKLRRTMAPFT